MPNITGEIEAVRRDGRGIKIGENWYSSYDGKETAGLRKGEFVSVEYVQKGPYKNIKSVAEATPEETTVSVSSAKAGKWSSPTGFPIPALARERSIIRQNALRHATAVILRKEDNSNRALDDIVYDIIYVAKHLEEYISGDLDTKVAIAEADRLLKEGDDE